MCGPVSVSIFIQFFLQLMYISSLPSVHSKYLYFSGENCTFFVFVCLFVCTDGPGGASSSPLSGVPGPGVARQCTTAGVDPYGAIHYVGQTVSPVVYGAARHLLRQHQAVQGGGREVVAGGVGW